jgi:hypothetical protein
MMRLVQICIATLILIPIAHAKAPIKLRAFSIGEVQARCAKVHGAFYNHDGAYGCAFAKGTVQCDGVSNCVGYQARPLRRPAVQPGSPGGIPPVAPTFQQYPEWQWHGENYRW